MVDGNGPMAWRVFKRAPVATRVFLGVIGVFALLQLGVLFVPALQREAMRTFHVANSSLPAWLVLQLRPAMYSFENETFVSAVPVLDELPSKSTPAVQRVALNHGSMQVATWWLRRELPDQFRTHFTLRSRYRGEEVRTEWRVESTPDGALRFERRPVVGEAK